MRNLTSFFRPYSTSGQNQNPFLELNKLQKQMDRLFQDFASSWSDDAHPGFTSFAPACDVEETESHYLMSFDLPGLKKEDIKIRLIDNELQISGERRSEHEEKAKSQYQKERFQGTFLRTFIIPVNVKPEQLQADYSDGVLRIAIPKVEASKGHSIAIVEGKSDLFKKIIGNKKEETKKIA